MAAITWKNINSRGNSDSARFLEGAGRSVNRGLDSVGNLLTGLKSTQEDNYKSQGKLNTLAFTEQLARYTTPEELQEAQNDGSLAEFRATLGANVDTTIVNAAAGGKRLSALQKTLTAEQDYSDTQTTRDNRDARANILKAARNPAANMDNINAQIEGGDFVDKDKLFNKAFNANVGAVDKRRVDNERGANKKIKEEERARVKLERARADDDFLQRKIFKEQGNLARTLGDDAVQQFPNDINRQERYLRSQAQAQGIPQDIIDGKIVSMRTSDDLTNALTTEQREQMAVLSQNAEEIQAQSDGRVTQEFQRAQSQFPLDGGESYKQAVTRDKVKTTLNDLGITDSTALSNLDKGVELAFKTKFPKSKFSETPQAYRKLKSNFMQKAAIAMGRASDMLPNFINSPGIDTKTFGGSVAQQVAEAVMPLLEEYNEFTNNEKQLRLATDKYNIGIGQNRSTANSRVSTQLKTFRNYNKISRKP